MNAANALEVAKVHPDDECLAHDITVWHEAPVAAVGAVVAVVAHHEILAGRHDAGELVFRIVASFAQRELLDAGEVKVAAIGRVQDAMLPETARARQFFFELLVVDRMLVVQVIVQRRVLDRLAVDGQALVFVGDVSPGTPTTRLM